MSTANTSGKDSTHAVDFHITYTNPENGKSITSVLGGPFVSESNGDGTITVTINGNDGSFSAPGLGLVWRSGSPRRREAVPFEPRADVGRPFDQISPVDQLVPGVDEVDGHGDAGSSTLPRQRIVR